MCEIQNTIGIVFATLLGFFGGIPVTLLILAPKVRPHIEAKAERKTIIPDAVTVDGKWVKWGKQ